MFVWNRLKVDKYLKCLNICQMFVWNKYPVAKSWQVTLWLRFYIVDLHWNWGFYLSALKLGMPADTKTDEFSEKLEKAFNPLLFSVLSDQRISERQEIPCLCCFIWPKDFRETRNFISMLFSVCPCLHQAVRSNLLLLCNCRQHPLKITSTF